VATRGCPTSAWTVEINGIAALFGLGYIIGLRYAAIIAGQALCWPTWCWCRRIYPVRAVHSRRSCHATAGVHVQHRRSMSANDDFRQAFVKPIGIGAIAVSGSHRHSSACGKIVVGSLTLGFKGFDR
jgi:hypothetical protein